MAQIKTASQDRDWDFLATMEAFGVEVPPADDTRERSYSLPAGDLKKLKERKMRKVRFCPGDNADNDMDNNMLDKAGNGHSLGNYKPSKKLPPVLEAFGAMPAPRVRQRRSLTLGPCDHLAFTRLGDDHKLGVGGEAGHPLSQQRRHTADNIFHTLSTSGTPGNSQECLAVLEAFGVLPAKPVSPPAIRKTRCFTFPSCDLKELHKNNRRKYASAISLSEVG